MFERSLSRHTWQDYLHYGIKARTRTRCQRVDARRALPGSHVLITAIQSWSQNTTVPNEEAFPSATNVGWTCSLSMWNLDLYDYWWTVNKKITRNAHCTSRPSWRLWILVVLNATAEVCSRQIFWMKPSSGWTFWRVLVMLCQSVLKSISITSFVTWQSADHVRSLNVLDPFLVKVLMWTSSLSSDLPQRWLAFRSLPRLYLDVI